MGGALRAPQRLFLLSSACWKFGDVGGGRRGRVRAPCVRGWRWRGRESVRNYAPQARRSGTRPYTAERVKKKPRN